MSDRTLLRRSEAPVYLKEKHGVVIATATLAKLATNGGGPVMTYMGRFPFYGTDDLDAWAAERISPPCRSTSERKALAASGS
jgi:hypothetical protein